MKHVKYIFLLVVLALVVACTKTNQQHTMPTALSVNSSSSLKIGKMYSTKLIRGQVLYLPVYSNVPYIHKDNKYDLNAFVSIHNTDFQYPITITRVLYYNNDGKLVANYLHKDSVLKPLMATNFFVPEKDQSGTGANFVVEWESDSLVSEPLIESVMIGLTGGQGISFLSTGKVLREVK